MLAQDNKCFCRHYPNKLALNTHIIPILKGRRRNVDYSKIMKLLVLGRNALIF